jgi:uncharacterized protein
MAGAEPEERVRLPVVHQSWRHVSFLHWRVDADAIARHLPAGLEPDVVDGSAWIGLTPFAVERFRVLGVPPGRFGSFHEANLRTYVRRPDGRDGIWFFSLDVSSRINAVGGRLAVPYFLATMTTEANGRVRYRSRRRTGPAAHHDITVEPGPPIASGDDHDLAALLTGRWRAFAHVAGRALLEIPVQHQRWPVHHAALVSLEETVLGAAGLPEPTSEPLVHYSPGVNAKLGAPRRP